MKQSLMEVSSAKVQFVVKLGSFTDSLPPSLTHSPICTSLVRHLPTRIRPYFADVIRMTRSTPHDALKFSHRQNSCTSVREKQTVRTGTRCLVRL